MVEQPVQYGGGQDRIAEDIAPVDEAFVAGQDDGGALVASCDQAEEQTHSTLHVQISRNACNFFLDKLEAAVACKLATRDPSPKSKPPRELQRHRHPDAPRRLRARQAPEQNARPPHAKGVALRVRLRRSACPPREPAARDLQAEEHAFPTLDQDCVSAPGRTSLVQRSAGSPPPDFRRRRRDRLCLYGE